ncbi:MAG: hypothetical protein KatS3mg090_0726 [Patescibacteria group bacterium]|nr:MAG: hypothetical protein KatS3mg090_0726 [Patescibacteria group bacterium]
MIKYLNLVFGFIYKNLLKIKKRYRAVIASILLTLLFLYSTFFQREYYLLFLLIFLVSVYLLTYFVILESINGIEWFMLFVMPVMISLSFYLFYFLFPGRWLTRFPFMIVFGLAMYAVLLANNILNTTVEKNIQLYRAGFAINFLLMNVVSFLFGVIIYSLYRGPIFIAVAVFVLSFVLSLQFVWSIQLGDKYSLSQVIIALVIALLTTEVAVLASFAPMTEVFFGIYISSFLYFISGHMYLFLENKIYPETTREFKVVIFLLFIILLFAAKF